MPRDVETSGGGPGQEVQAAAWVAVVPFLVWTLITYDIVLEAVGYPSGLYASVPTAFSTLSVQTCR